MEDGQSPKKKTVIPGDIHHRQNALKSTYEFPFYIHKGKLAGVTFQ
jgi:hypothetical protein